jgi:predicted Zn finger-like uncharacterized protein
VKDDTSFILECPQCFTRYELPVAIPEHGRKVRCARCAHVWLARPGDTVPAWDDDDQDIIFREQEPDAVEPSATPPREAGVSVSGQAAAQSPADADGGAQSGPADEDITDAGETAAAEEAVSVVPEAGEAESDTAAREARAPSDTGAGFDEEAAAGAAPETDAGAAELAVAAAETDTEMDFAEGRDFAAEEAVADDGLDAAFEPEAPHERQAHADESRPGEDGQDQNTGTEAAAEEDENVENEDAADTVAAFYGDEPEDDDPAGEAETQRIAAEAKRRLPVSAGVVAGWGMICLILFGLGVLAVAQRASIIRTMPASAWAYETFGMPVNVRGLDFRDVAYSWETEAGQVVLAVHGDIVNITQKTVEVPAVMLSLRDGSETEIYRWEDMVVEEPLAPDASATFAVRIPAPPEATESVKVHFARN